MIENCCCFVALSEIECGNSIEILDELDFSWLDATPSFGHHLDLSNSDSDPSQFLSNPSLAQLSSFHFQRKSKQIGYFFTSIFRLFFVKKKSSE